MNCYLFCYLACGGFNWIKGRARHIPPQTDTVVRFAPEHVVLFLRLSNLGSNGRHKATTRNSVPQGIGRLQYISSQSDTVVRFAPEYVVIFWHLWNLGRKGRHKATTRNGVPQGR